MSSQRNETVIVTGFMCAGLLACAAQTEDLPARKATSHSSTPEPAFTGGAGTAGVTSGVTAGATSSSAGNGGAGGSTLGSAGALNTAGSSTSGVSSGSGLSLPFVVDDEFNPSGFMGEGSFSPDALAITPSESLPDATCGGSRAPAPSGDCHVVSWHPVADPPVAQQNLSGWVGIYWQKPNNNWASSGRPANQIKPGATAVTFYARGSVGGEKVAFFVGEFGGDTIHISSTGEYGNNGMGTPEVLTTEWTQYSIDMSGVDYSSGLYGVFGFYASATDNPDGVVFDLDAIAWQ